MNPVNLENQVRTLAHRLEKTKQKKNESLSNNCQLKSKIDILRNDKVMFDEIYANLKLSLKETTVELWETIIKNERAAELRERLNNKLKGKISDIKMEKNQH